MSKLDAGKLDIASVAYDLPVALEDAMRLMRQRAGERGLTLRLERPPDLPPIGTATPPGCARCC